MTKVQFAVLTALLTAILAVQVLPVISPARAQPSWEYTIEDLRDEKFIEEINRSGTLGWEVVFARRASSGEGDNMKMGYEVIYKRPK